MRHFSSIVLLFIILVGLMSCSSNKFISPDNPESQESVRIALQDGTQREGIIINGDSEQLYYVDSETHQKEAIKFNNVKWIKKISTVYDFNGNAIPVPEIKSYKNPKNMLLYGSGGLILGATIGTAAGIGLYAADQPLMGNVSILLFGGLGAWFFGQKGAAEDWDEAAFKARKARYQNSKLIENEKQKIEELKKQKQELLEKIEGKNKEK
ncbi:MAG: hypothetical protein GF313_02325 [Caldithrix sp.]|nr:hypothetical protein [Caldithrix sp.]